MRRLVILLAVMGAMLALSAGAALPEAETETFTDTFTNAAVTVNPCNGEPIVGEATYHITGHFTDSTHRYVIIELINFKLSSAGLVTGADYQASFMFKETQLGEALPTNQVNTPEVSFLVIAVGGDPDFVSHSLFHMTVTPNG